MCAIQRNLKKMSFGIGLLSTLLALGSLMADVVLVPPADLAAPRRELIDKALAFLAEHPSIPYLEGGADVTGMDCSGAIVRLLKLVGIEPPRSSHGQYEWLKKAGRLTLVPSTNLTADDAIYRTLLPGDLIFWAHDNTEEEFRVSHVHMYLGEEKDGHAVMIGSSDGRSYRGKKIIGFGIVDYRVPKAGSATRIVAFGSALAAPTKKSPDKGIASPSALLNPNP